MSHAISKLVGWSFFFFSKFWDSNVTTDQFIMLAITLKKLKRKWKVPINKVFFFQIFLLPGEFPSDIYAGHHPFCVRPAVFEGDNENSVSPSEQRDAVDYSECPICLERFPEDVLPVHASECGL